MSVGSLQAIAPNPAQPAGYSLLVASDTPTGDVPANSPEQTESAKWAMGVQWAPEQVLGGAALGRDCLGSTAGFGDVEDENPIINTAEPFVVAAMDQCSTFGYLARDWQGRARRQLLATQSHWIARELQLGTLRDALTLDNSALVDGTAVSVGAARPEHALSLIEAQAGISYGGRRAMFYCDPLVLTLLKSRGAITLSGQKWLTAMGNVVAADTGFTTESSNHFIYATLPPIVRLGEIIVVPGADDASRAQATNRATNLTTVIAERLALVQFDASKVSPQDLIWKQQVDVTHDFDDV